MKPNAKHPQRPAGRVIVTGAGCVRADRYGTLEVDGQPLVPLLAARLARQGAGGDRPFAARVTITVELLAQPPLAVAKGGRQ